MLPNVSKFQRTIRSHKETNHQSTVHFLGIRGEESDSVPVIPYFPENLCCGKNNVIRPFERERTQLFECVSSAAPPCVKIQIQPSAGVTETTQVALHYLQCEKRSKCSNFPFLCQHLSNNIVFLRFCGKGRDTCVLYTQSNGEKKTLYFTEIASVLEAVFFCVSPCPVNHIRRHSVSRKRNIKSGRILLFCSGD